MKSPYLTQILVVLSLLLGFTTIAQGQQKIGEIMRDRSVDWKNPQERALMIQRIKKADIRDLQKAKKIAKERGKPTTVVFPSGKIRELVGINEDGELLYYETKNVDAAISSGADQLHAQPYSVDGSGLKVGVWENSSPRTSHREFNEGATSRVNNIQNLSFGDHATHVAGTIAAVGISANAKGMAYGATIDAYRAGDDITYMPENGATAPGQFDSKVYVSNHSYGYSYGWRENSSDVWEWKGDGTDQNAVDYEFGKYSGTSVYFDFLAYNTPYHLVFWAAGNENTDGPNQNQQVLLGGVTVNYDSAIHPPNDGEYRNDFETVGDHTTAKNLLVVGAATDAVTNGQRDPSKASKASWSSTGPCDDGRIKPDLMGNGVGLYSSLNGGDASYGSYSGTSMATPNVCGSAALVVAKYRELFGVNAAMRASTLKGLLIHTATDIGNPGPDYTNGWGLVDVKSAVDFLIDSSDSPSALSLEENELSSSNATQSYTFTWDGESAIRATLCWTDPFGPEQTGHDSRTPALVNDLNLKLIAPDNTEYFPFVMPFVGTWTVASMSQNATTGINTVDNVEQVLIANPGQAGTWTVEISHAGSLTNNVQDYGLLVSGSFDPAGTLSFGSDSYSVNEETGTVTITVARTGGSVGGVSVDYATSNGTATAGTDYTATSGTLSWNNNGSGPKTFTIPITDDSIHGDPEKTVTITLSNPSGIGISGTNPVTLTIREDDNQLPTANAGSAQTVYLSGSEWTPNSLSPALWLDASDSTTVTLNGTTVSQWDDKSLNNNRHATQLTPGNQPTLTSGGLNSMDVLTFDGNSDFLNLDLDFMAGGDHSVFVVTKPTSYNNIYGAANSGSGSSSLHVGFQNNSKYRMNYWGNDWYGNISSNFKAGEANLLNYVWLSGSSKEIFANGQSEGTNLSAGTVGAMAGGGRISNVTGHGFYGGDIAEFIAFGKSLTLIERQKLEGFLAHKWGTTARLATDHPYKSVSPNSATATATLAGTASDPDGDSTSVTWSLVSGPGIVTFGNENAVDTTAGFTATGTYTLRLTVNDGYGTPVSDDVVITVEEEVGVGPDISVSAISGNTGENGNAATFTVVLTTQPTADVTIGLSSSDTGEGTVSPASLTFTNGNWDTAQTVTVTGVEDILDDGDQVFTIVTAAASSADADYNGLNPGDVSVTNADDDFTLTVVTGSGGDSTTGGGVVDPDNSPYAITATAATGYNFLNWTVSSGSATFADANSASTTVTVSADATIQANFDPDNYTITYSGNGHTGGNVPDPQGKTHGVDLALASNTGALVKDGYAFDGWNTASDGSGTDYAEGATYSGNSDITLYANWNSPPTVAAGGAQTVYMTGSNVAWTPADVSTIGWYDASDANNVVVSGTNVTTWKDISGNGYDLDQTPTAPKYDGSQINGLNIINFDTTFAEIYRSGIPDIDCTEVTLVSVGQSLSWGNFPNYGTLYSADSSDKLHLRRSATNNRLNGVLTLDSASTAVDNSNDTAYATGVPFMSAVYYDGDRLHLRGNGGSNSNSADVANAATFTINEIQAGRDNNTMGHYHGEMIVLNTTDLATLQKVEGYLAHKWGLEAALPVGHPYKTEPPMKSAGSATATLAGQVTDAEDTPTNTWSDTGTGTGTGTVTITNPSVLNSDVTFSDTGTYVLQLTAEDGFQQVSDTVTISVELPPLSVSILDAEISEDGGTTTATITRIDTAGDLVVTLSSSDTGEATVPATATILNGNSSVDVTVTGVPDGIADATATVTVTASAEGNAAGSDTVVVTDVDTISHTVIYNGNTSDGGTVPVDGSSPYADNAIVTVLGNTGSLTKAGHVFTGWNTATDGSGAGYVTGETFIITNDITLYAQWSTTYAGWTSGLSGTLTDPAPAVDFDNGGVETGLEWVYGGDPTSENDDATIGPVIDHSDPEFVTFTFRRSDEANADPGTSIVVQYGSDLTAWSPAIDDGIAVIFIVTDDFYGPGIDRVEVKIDWDSFTGDKAFMQLQVDLAP